MKNGTYDFCLLVSELQFHVQYPEVGVKTQPPISILTYKLYPHQHITPHCTFDIQLFFFFFGTHTTPCLPFWGQWSQFCTFELAGGKGLVFPVGWFEVKSPVHHL